METKPAFSAAVVEVLEQDNYLDWSVRVKTCLTAHGLWDIVESRSDSSTTENEATFKVWSETNAMALLVIQNSCGRDTFSDIREITSARIAWETLATNYKPKGPDPSSSMASVPLEEDNIDSGTEPGESDIEGNIDSGVEKYRYLKNALQSGSMDAVEELLSHFEDAYSAKITDTGKTALHVAAEAGRVGIVQNLVWKMSAEDLQITDDEGFTALARATCNGNYYIAECMLGKSAKLCTIQSDIGNIPVVVALYGGHLKLARYLYSLTPLEILEAEEGMIGATVVCEAIYNKALDIALDLVNRRPRLVVAQDRNGVSPFYALACMPDYFLSGNRLVFWKRWIYTGIHIQSGGPINEIRLNIQIPEVNEGIQIPEVNERTDNETTGSESRLVSSLQTLLGQSLFSFCAVGLSLLLSLLSELVSHLQTLLGRPLSSLCDAGLSLWIRLVSNLHTLLGIKHLYEMKLTDFQSNELLTLMKDQLSFSNIQQMGTGRVQEAIVRATKEGIFEFVFEMVKVVPLFVWIENATSSNIFSVAVQYRRAKIFSLICGLDMRNALASSPDSSGNNLLHMAGMSADSTSLNDIPGAALKMQRELQWFKEVESIVPPLVHRQVNRMGLTPRQLFTKNHEDMMSKGEKWMKDTASSCTVVGALIVTIMFAVVFTVPGGNDQKNGFPIFLNKKLFMVFIVSDALSLFSSATSVLMFLGILTSRYAEEDFLVSLPRKMIIGLSTLFFSIVAMMTTFSVALLLLLHEQSWIFKPIICLASIPITLFVLMQFPLLGSMASSTYGSSIFDRKMKRWF